MCACSTYPYPVILVQNQNICYQMGFYKLELFHVSNGVRKGGILFPYLCIVYDLSNILNSPGTGCQIHNCCISHVFYADDSCVTATRPSGLQGLLNSCTKFDLENDVKCNPIKSLCMIFKPHGFHLKCPDNYKNLNNKYT